MTDIWETISEHRICSGNTLTFTHDFSKPVDDCSLGLKGDWRLWERQITIGAEDGVTGERTVTVMERVVKTGPIAVCERVQQERTWMT